jgi:hypothetical protein
MNGTSDDIRKAFFDTLVGHAVTTKGLVADHDEALTRAGVQQIWDALKLADLKIMRAS